MEKLQLRIDENWLKEYAENLHLTEEDNYDKYHEIVDWGDLDFEWEVFAVTIPLVGDYICAEIDHDFNHICNTNWFKVVRRNIYCGNQTEYAATEVWLRIIPLYWEEV